MTFCLGISVEEGLVGIADTRVVSGSEALMASKVATYQGPGFSFFIQNSGLRSLRDRTLLYFEEAFSRSTAAREKLFKLVNLYAAQVRRIAEEDTAALQAWRAREAAGQTSYVPSDEVRQRLGLTR